MEADGAVANEVKGDVAAGSDKDLMENVYKALTKLLDKAGHNDKCTPALLRQKCATNMGLASTALDKYQFIIHKMIIKWWKASGEKEKEKKTDKADKKAEKADKAEKKAEKVEKAEKAEKAEKTEKKAEKAEKAEKTEKKAAPSSSASLSSLSSASASVKKEVDPVKEQLNTIYKKLRMLAKDLKATAFMDGLAVLETTESKVSTLLQRFRDAGMPLSDDPTETEMQSIRDKHTPSAKREREEEGEAGTAKVAKQGP